MKYLILSGFPIGALGALLVAWALGMALAMTDEDWRAGISGPRGSGCHVCGKSLPYMNWNGKRLACEEHMALPALMAWYLDQLGDA